LALAVAILAVLFGAGLAAPAASANPRTPGKSTASYGSSGSVKSDDVDPTHVIACFLTPHHPVRAGSIVGATAHWDCTDTPDVIVVCSHIEFWVNGHWEEIPGSNDCNSRYTRTGDVFSDGHCPSGTWTFRNYVGYDAFHGNWQRGSATSDNVTITCL